MEHATFSTDRVRVFADLAVEQLSQAREEIDALNVYPVPDGDTGTNMFLTAEAARDAMRQTEGDDLGALLVAYSRGALLGARGNSGVILSQLIGALFRTMAASGPSDRSAAVFAEGMVAAADAAYAAVGRPVEGTILSVARAAADAAIRQAEEPECRLADVLTVSAAAAHVALDRTPEQMQLLKDAGVVDAGGRGLCVILDAAETALTGRRPVELEHVPLPRPAPPLPTGDLTEDGPAYEVMYLLDAADEDVPALRRRLNDLGDSLVIVGGEGLWNVHVHVDDVGAAVEAGIETGTPRRIKVTHFAEQITRARARRDLHLRTGRGVVAIAAGPGLESVFAEAGATVIRGGPGRRASTGEILEAIELTGAAEVIVLPNDPDTLGVARAAATAAEENGVHVVVIPTRAQVQGIAALAVHEPERPLEDDVVQMTAAARDARDGAVTVATKQAMTSAGPCEAGDVLGVLAGDFVIVGHDQFEVATGLLERLMAGGGELVTLVTGEQAGDLVERLRTQIENLYAGVDVMVYDGGQPRYPLLLSVE